MSRRLYQRQIPLYLVSVIAGLFIVEYFFGNQPTNPLTIAKNELTLWSTVIYGFVLLYSFIFLIMGQVRTVAREKGPKRIRNSLVCIGAIIFFYTLSYVFPRGPSDPSYQTMYLFLVTYAAAARSVPWSLGGAYCCYRYLRLTSLEATVLTVAALFTMFRGTTVLTLIWPPFYGIGVWIESVLATSVIMAFVTAAAIGTIVLTIRGIAGREPGLIELEVT